MEEKDRILNKEKKENPRLILDDWQKEVLSYEGDFILCTGRQVGKTTIMAIKAAEYMIKHPNVHIIIASLTEDQAKLIIVMILDYLEKNYKPYMKVRKKDKPTQNKVTITNKSTALARPIGNTGDAIRGFTGDVLILDEASRMPELAFTAGEPVLLTTGGQIWMCSTPFGKQGYFYRMFENRDNLFKVFHKSSEDVIHDRPLSDTWTAEKREKAIARLNQQKLTKSELEYGQEYLGLFIDELRQYFSDEWIDKVCTLRRPDAFLHGRDYYLGVDIARMGEDESSFEVVMKVSNENMQHVVSETTTKTVTTQTEDKIYDYDRVFGFKKIYVDAGSGSLGVGIYDHLLKNEQTKRKVVAINNRKVVQDREGKGGQRLLKEDLYDNLRALGQRGFIFLLNDEKVRLSLKSVQYEYLTTKIGKSQMRIFGNDTHIAEGLIRAAWCSKEKNIRRLIYSFKA